MARKPAYWREGAGNVSDQQHSSEGNGQIIAGVALLVLGLIITVATYSSASSSPSGGTYIVAYGPIIFGVVSIFRGLAAKTG